MKRSPLRVFAAVCILAACVCYIVCLYSALLSNKNAAKRDFISYWCAGQQFMRGANPYDFKAVQGMEIAVGRDPGLPVLVMRNPPVAFFLAWPLGLFSPKTGLIVWLLVLMACLSISIWILWLLNGQPDNRLHLLGYLFAPALVCLMAGQFGIFLLLGVVLFLYFHQTRPALAGAALLLCAFKPHLFLPLIPVLFLWVIGRKAYSIFAGFAVALAADCALSFCIDPHGWLQYARMMRAGEPLDEFVPALSVAFRFLVDRNAAWLQFVPVAAACAWALWYFWTRRAHWNWNDQGLLLLLVSILCSPYAWFTDEAMLLPAMLAGLYQAVESRRSLLPLGLFAGGALIEVLANIQIITLFYLWTTPAWLLWYLYATGRIGTRKGATYAADRPS